MRMMTDKERADAAENTLQHLELILDRWLDRMKPYTQMQYGKQDILKAKEALEEYRSILNARTVIE